jgi:hypothetical protein
MDDGNKLLGYLVIVAAFVALAVLVIDFKIKNDLIKTAIKIDGDLRNIQVYTGTAVPRRETAPENGSHPVSNWDGHIRSGDLVDQPAVVETRGRFAEPETASTEETGPIESGPGNPNPGIPAED